MNIIEKLGTSEEIKQYNMYQFPGEMIEEPNGEYVTYDDYVKLKKQRDELLRALINLIRITPPISFPKTYARVIKARSVIESISNKPWEKIKELLND